MTEASPREMVRDLKRHRWLMLKSVKASEWSRTAAGDPTVVAQMAYAAGWDAALESISKDPTRRDIFRELEFERLRQIELGYTQAHDDDHSVKELLSLAIDRLLESSGKSLFGLPVRRQVEKATSILVALMETRKKRDGDAW